MKKFKEFYKKNRVYSILMIVSLICIVSILVGVIVYFVGQTAKDKYGNRLDGIKSVEINSDKKNEISNVTEVITYESVMDDSKKDEAIKALEEGNLDYITFASSSTVKNFINLIGEENKSKLSNTKIISIGKITTKTILDNGLEVYKESEKASIESMIEAMCD